MTLYHLQIGHDFEGGETKPGLVKEPPAPFLIADAADELGVAVPDERTEGQDGVIQGNEACVLSDGGLVTRPENFAPFQERGLVQDGMYIVNGREEVVEKDTALAVVRCLCSRQLFFQGGLR